MEGWHNVFPTVVSLLLDEVPMGDKLAARKENCVSSPHRKGWAINWHATFGDGSLFRTAMPHGVGLKMLGKSGPNRHHGNSTGNVAQHTYAFDQCR